MTIADSKRIQQTEAIIEAALRALRTHGYAATSLARIAEEAGTSKRMVLHYFASREELFEAVVRRVCRRILRQVEQAIAEQEDPAVGLDEGLDQLWDEILADPGLHAVFFGLLAESVTDPTLRATIHVVRAEYRELISRVIAASRPADAPLTPDEAESAATLVLATVVGLTIDFLERGDTPALRRAFADFKHHVDLITSGQAG
ncbi:MAG TPA: TetR/AcrR family transcriptional regulator [Solirubrobacteraceae bacterium]